MKTPILKKVLTLSLIATVAFTACKKDKAQPEVEKETIGAYVLSEGSYPDGNSAIDYYDIKTKAVQKNYFKAVNGYELGKNATDLKIYGSKMYCTVTGNSGAKDSYVEVINVATGKSVKRIPFFENTTSFLPRSVAFHGTKVVVSCYDGNLRAIDTASLNITNTLLLGDVLEGTAIFGNKLYVAKTSHIIFPSTIKNAVSVVNLTTFTKIKDITVNFNPIQIEAVASGDVFVQTAGDYNLIDPSLDKINNATETKTIGYPLNLSLMAFSGTRPLAITDYGAGVKHFNLTTGTLGANFITDDTKIKTAYAITFNDLNQDIYISDTMNYGTEGTVYAFNSNGQKQFSFPTSATPKHIIFKYNK